MRKKYKFQLEFVNMIAHFSCRDDVFKKFLGRAGRLIKFTKNARINRKIILTLTGDAQIKALNKTYRGVDKPTDVLSFSYMEGGRFPSEDVCGEILISVPTARRQAREHGKSLEQELQFLFVHGLLHVFGHDHQKTSERKKMFDLQDKILGNKSWRAIADREAEE